MITAAELKDNTEVTIVLNDGSPYTGTVEKLDSQCFITEDRGISGYWFNHTELLGVLV